MGRPAYKQSQFREEVSSWKCEVSGEQGPVATSGSSNYSHLKLRPSRNRAKRSQLGRSFKFEVSSIKQAKPMVGDFNSHFPLQTRPKAVRAKQSQFPPERHQGQVLYGQKVMTNLACARPWQNKANSRPRDGRPARPRFYPARVPLPHRAHKQSQSGLSRQTKPIGAATRCTNKPNSPTPPTQRRRRAGSRRNKANFRPSDRPDGPGIRHPVPGTSPRSATVKKRLRRGRLGLRIHGLDRGF